MTWTHHAAEAEFAVCAVRTAAGLCREARRDAVKLSRRKDDATPVTEADYASQALIAGWLAEAFPGDSLVAEEDSRTLSSDPAMAERVVARVRRARPDADAQHLRSWLDRGNGRARGRFWTLDPIDGTKGFVRGDQYVIALALIEAGRVSVAALAAPMLGIDLQPRPNASGCIAIAVQGLGAWAVPIDGEGARRLKTSECRVLSEARLLRSVEDEHTDPRQLARIATQAGLRRPPIALDSQVKYLIIAGGEAELLVRLLPSGKPGYKEKLWDVAAGALVVEEAGGRVTDLDGRPLDMTAGRELTRNHGSLISNGRLHDAALSAVSAVLAEVQH